jgi:hypothetical protein
VIPHDVEVDVASGSLPERAGSIAHLVTNWWVERCLFGKRLVDPTDDVLSRPFDKLSINGKLLVPVQITSLVMLTYARVLRANGKLYGIFWNRASACDESHHINGYGNKFLCIMFG